MSSDTLQPAAFTWDLLHTADAWAGFQQSREPSFFPDLAIFAPVQAASGNWRVAMAVWVFVVIAWLAAVAGWIAAAIARSGFQAATAAVLLLLTVVLAAAAYGALPVADATGSLGTLFPFRVILLPFTHGGSFLLALTVAALAYSAIGKPARTKTACIFLLSAAAGVSDLLCVISLLAPLTRALLYGRTVGMVSRRTTTVLLSASWIGAALGLAGAQTLARQPMPIPAFLQSPRHIGIMLTDLRHCPAIIAVVCAWVVIAILGLRHRRRDDFVAFWPVFGGTSAVLSFALMAVMYEDIWVYRYALPFLWWPVIFAAAALTTVSRRHPGAVRVPVAAITVLLVFGHFAGGWRVPPLLTWQSPLASCLRQTGLTAGLGDYWTARATSAATDWQVQVEQVDPAGAAFVWGNDRLWFTHDIHAPSRPPPFRFIVMDRLLPDEIAKSYGHPDRLADCAGSAVWIYDDPDAVYRNLARASR